MKKHFKVLFALAILALSSCEKVNEITEPVLSLSSTNDLTFTAAGQESYEIGVLTNQTNWRAVSDQSWCVITPSSDLKSFTVTSLDNIAGDAPKAAKITVTALTDNNVVSTITINATQDFMLAGLKFVRIPKGTFIMGRGIVGKPDWNFITEAPAHYVTLSHDFMMGECEITNAQYAAFLNAKGIKGVPEVVVRKVSAGTVYENGAYVTKYRYDDINLSVAKGPTPEDGEQIYTFDSTFDPSIPKGESWQAVAPRDWGLNFTNDQWVPAPGYENHPVINVGWHGARAFAHWLGAELPTEAQWEYVAKTGYPDPFVPFTQAEFAELGWAFRTSSDLTASTEAVGQKKPNLRGVYDLFGNVQEMCLDRFDLRNNTAMNTYTEASVTDPLVCGGTSSVFRGSGITGNTTFMTPTVRVWSNMQQFEWDESYRRGFRLVINLKN